MLSPCQILIAIASLGYWDVAGNGHTNTQTDDMASSVLTVLNSLWLENKKPGSSTYAFQTIISMQPDKHYYKILVTRLSYIVWWPNSCHVHQKQQMAWSSLTDFSSCGYRVVSNFLLYFLWRCGVDSEQSFHLVMQTVKGWFYSTVYPKCKRKMYPNNLS